MSERDGVHDIAGQHAFTGVVLIGIVSDAVGDWVVRKTGAVSVHKLLDFVVVGQRAELVCAEVVGVSRNFFQRRSHDKGCGAGIGPKLPPARAHFVSVARFKSNFEDAEMGTDAIGTAKRG